MQVQFNHEARTTGVLFVKYTHFLTVRVEFNEEELFLINELNLKTIPMFDGPSTNFVGRGKLMIFTVKDLIAGPITLHFSNLQAANNSEITITEQLQSLKDDLYAQHHDRHGSRTIEI